MMLPSEDFASLNDYIDYLRNDIKVVEEMQDCVRLQDLCRCPLLMLKLTAVRNFGG